MTALPYTVTRTQHGGPYPWKWRCHHAEQIGADPRPVRCPEGGPARSQDEATAAAAAHARTHQEDA